MADSTRRGSSVGSLSPQCPPVLGHHHHRVATGLILPAENSTLGAEILLVSLEKTQARHSPRWKRHRLATARGKLAANGAPGLPSSPGFFPFQIFFPIETATQQQTAAMPNRQRDGSQSQRIPLGAPQAPQPCPALLSPSPLYCSNSTRHGYKNKTAM